MTDDETAQLTRAMAAGDERAVRVFFDGYFKLMYAHARTITGRDEAFCLDIVQDALLRVLRSVRVVRSSNQLSAWVLLVVRSVAYDALRSESRRVRRDQHAAREKPEAFELAEPDDERLEAMADALRRVDPELLRLIELRYTRQWSLRQIAEALGVSVGTIDGRLRRVLLKLRDAGIDDANENLRPGTEASES